MKHVVLYVGHLYKPFWTKKIWPGRQEGPGKVKIWHIWVISMGHVHQCIILTFPDPPCQPGQIFWSKMACTGVPHIVLHSLFPLAPPPLGGILGPLKSDLGRFLPFQATYFIRQKYTFCRRVQYFMWGSRGTPKSEYVICARPLLWCGLF